MFLTQVCDAVKVPVIATRGIADARGIVAAFAVGASAVQIGTAYFLLCPEAKVSPVHREALRNAKDNQTVLTNVFTSRPARGIVNRLVREVKRSRHRFSNLAYMTISRWLENYTFLTAEVPTKRPCSRAFWNGRFFVTCELLPWNFVEPTTLSEKQTLHLPFT